MTWPIYSPSYPPPWIKPPRREIVAELSRCTKALAHYRLACINHLSELQTARQATRASETKNQELKSAYTALKTRLVESEKQHSSLRAKHTEVTARLHAADQLAKERGLQLDEARAGFEVRAKALQADVRTYRVRALEAEKGRQAGVAKLKKAEARVGEVEGRLKGMSEAYDAILEECKLLCPRRWEELAMLPKQKQKLQGQSRVKPKVQRQGGDICRCP
ncbi:MAG: hypothetical protein M1825_002116 [Sarcosagium campestre]|nr:MAG: hypothetical protein M1825_002116 [Sarcosagium campestre]